MSVRRYDTALGLADPGLPLPQMLACRAQDDPDRVLFETVTGEKETFAEFDRSARTWADAFRNLGVGSENVATLLPTSIDAYRAWLGLAWVGACEVPLNTDYRGRMLVHALTQCDTAILVTRSDFWPRIAEVLHAVPHLKTVVLTDTLAAGRQPVRVVVRDQFLAGARPAEGLEGPRPWDPACIIYTSGTTGPSKGVIDPWPNIYLSSLRVFPADLMDEDEVIYGAGQVYHLSGKFPPYLATVLGGRVVLRERMSMTDFWDDITAFGITNAIVPGVLATFLLRKPEGADDHRTPLRNVMMAAPVIADYEEFARRFDVRLATCYGMTEIGMVMGRRPGEITPETHESCGMPHAEHEVRIVDAHDFEVPRGTVGELIIRSSAPWVLNAGYYGFPDQTARAWRNGWFHTGDAFRQDEEGNFYFVDRIKDCIRRRGENISSFEVETHVNEHPAVQESAAIPVPDARGRLFDEEVKIVVVLGDGMHLEPAELIEFLIPRMPRFMIPRYVEFVDVLPKTQNLKTRKFLLRENAVNGQTWDRQKAGVELPR